MYKLIRILNMDASIVQRLEKANLYTVNSVINADLEKIGFESNTINYIKNFISNYIDKGISAELIHKWARRDFSFLDTKYSLFDLEMPVRTYNSLIRNKITKISQLVNIVINFKTGYLKGFGNRSSIIVIKIVKKIIEKEGIENTIFDIEHPIDALFVNKIGISNNNINSLKERNIITLQDLRLSFINGDIFNWFNTKTINAILDVFEKYLTENNSLNFIFLKNKLMHFWFGFVTIDKLNELYGKGKVVVSDEYLKRVNKDEHLLVEDGVIRLKYFKEVVFDSNFKARIKDIILKRFSGNTLQEIATVYHLTRERIRQIIRDRCVNINFFYEASFFKEYNKFNWHPEIFKTVYNLDDFSYNVISYYTDKKESSHYDLPLEYIESINNNLLFTKTNFNVLELKTEKIFGKIITIYGKKVNYLSKKDFLEYVIANYLPSYGLHKSEILKLANMVSKENDLTYHFSTFVDVIDNIVIGLRNIRYYNYKNLMNEDINKLFTILSNIEGVYSATYFYDQYPDLMKKIDINDGYELHSLLKHIFENNNEIKNKIEFLRQPIIAQKGSNVNLLVKSEWGKLTGNIKVSDFAKKLIERYGFHKFTILNNINNVLGNYIFDKILYNFEAIVSDEILNKIKIYFVDSYYEAKQITTILEKNGFTKKDFYYFSNTWLNKIGYKTHDMNYIINVKYKSIKDVFIKDLKDYDIYELGVKESYIKNTTLMMITETMRKYYHGFRVDNKIYTIKYFVKQGITKQLLKKYVKTLEDYLPLNFYFTYDYLLKQNYQKDNETFEKIENANIPKEIILHLLKNVKGMKKSTKGNLFCRTSKTVLVEDFLKQLKQTYNVNDEKAIQIAEKEFNISFGKFTILKK
ncbi:MAG: sigma factor-like helix-turn-helix DNA-binding protein [Bacilli bacterium]